MSSRDDGGAHRTSLSSLANVPTCRFLPTRENKRREEIDKEVCALLIGIIKKREKAMKTGTHNDDLLGVLMESNFKHLEENGNHKMLGMTIDDVIAECKLFYFAGQETTAVLLTWTMIMLSMNPDWQERGREEVLQVFGKNKPEFDGLNRLKIVSICYLYSFIGEFSIIILPSFPLFLMTCLIAWSLITPSLKCYKHFLLWTL